MAARHETSALGVIKTIKPLTYEQYAADENIRLLIERSIEIIGEAARHVSRAFQEAHPEVPWKKIIAQRHILAHEYGEIESELIWRVATVYIPELLDVLNAMLSEA